MPISMSYAAPSLADPEALGFRSSGLAELDHAMGELVRTKKLAGITTLLARRGKLVHFKARGYSDLRTMSPLKPDSIFRIASMTKPIVAVAMMILHEAGRWTLDDPVEKHIPQFRDLKVRAIDGYIDPQITPMTMRQLMSHSAGFDFGMSYDLAELTATDLAGMVDKLSALPLAFQPGTDWRYGPSVDVQAYLVETLSGMSLDRFLNSHIFEPLRMSDTSFYVPLTSAHRVVGVNKYDSEGNIISAPETKDPTARPTFFSGSGGLFSTALDYWRFAQMVANEGVLDGARIIQPASARLLRQDMLPSNVKVDVYGPVQEGVGFGLNFAVLVDPHTAGSPMGRGSHWWGGGYGTWFWIDPENEIVFIVLIQNLRGTIPHAGTPPLREITPRLVYGSLQHRQG